MWKNIRIYNICVIFEEITQYKFIDSPIGIVIILVLIFNIIQGIP